MTTLEIRVDSTGFPMVWIDEIDAFMHWIPVTKIQFEYFLCASSDSHFDARWYDQILELNSRVSPKGIRANNYWKAFLTGITPDEVERFAHWCGEDYSVMTLDEWFTAYNVLKEMGPEDKEIFDDLPDLAPRTRTLLTRLDTTSRRSAKEANYQQTLADQTLMRMGVMEWVYCSNSHYQWGGMGETNPDFYGTLFTPDAGQPSVPVDPEVNRMYYYGFRLIRGDE